jgi:probable rRNA maturation factor
VSLNTANFIFCSDEYLRSINKKYLSHNYRTDIITFDLRVDKAIIADVFISVDRAKANALFYKVSTTSELLRLLIHGTLHLCGYDDKTTADFNQMKKLEEKYLKSFHVKL